MFDIGHAFPETGPGHDTTFTDTIGGGLSWAFEDEKQGVDLNVYEQTATPRFWGSAFEGSKVHFTSCCRVDDPKLTNLLVEEERLREMKSELTKEANRIDTSFATRLLASYSRGCEDYIASNDDDGEDPLTNLGAGNCNVLDPPDENWPEALRKERLTDSEERTQKKWEVTKFAKRFLELRPRLITVDGWTAKPAEPIYHDAIHSGDALQRLLDGAIYERRLALSVLMGFDQNAQSWTPNPTGFPNAPDKFVIKIENLLDDDVDHLSRVPISDSDDNFFKYNIVTDEDETEKCHLLKACWGDNRKVIKPNGGFYTAIGIKETAEPQSQKLEIPLSLPKFAYLTKLPDGAECMPACGGKEGPCHACGEGPPGDTYGAQPFRVGKPQISKKRPTSPPSRKGAPCEEIRGMRTRQASDRLRKSGMLLNSDFRRRSEPGRPSGAEQEIFKHFILAEEDEEQEERELTFI
eukprot:g20117.t1